MSKFGLCVASSLLCWVALLVGPSSGASWRHCAVSYVTQPAPVTSAFSVSREEIEKIIADAANAIGLPLHGTTVIPCNDGTAQKVISYYSDGLPPLAGGAVLPRGNYIIFDPVWLQEVIGSNRTEAMFIFGHELAHLLGGHLTFASSLPRGQQELYADDFGGCVVAKLGGNWHAVDLLLKRLRPIKSDGLYGGAEESVNAARTGFERCGGLSLERRSPEQNDVRVEYWKGRGDGELIELALESAGISITKTIDWKSKIIPPLPNTLTCSSSVPVVFLKRVANALLDADVPLSSIYEASNSARQDHVGIAYRKDFDGSNLLTREEIENLTECPGLTLDQDLIFVRNDCPVGPITVWLRILTRATGKWEFFEVAGLGYGKTRVVTDLEGRAAVTDHLTYSFSAVTLNQDGVIDDLSLWWHRPELDVWTDVKWDDFSESEVGEGALRMVEHKGNQLLLSCASPQVEFE